MNTFIYPMKVHAVKLEYRRLMLMKLPHGCFKTIDNKQYVIVTYDPSMPNVNSRHPRKILASTNAGKELCEKVCQYLSIKSEYDQLLSSWNNTYRFAPPKINFPIRQVFDPHGMNNEYFNKLKDNLGRYIADNPTVGEYGIYKSKNELMAADTLKHLGIPFKYETELYIPETSESINPDFVADFYEIDKCAYLEVMGMNDKGDYSVRTASKINSYSKGKYRPGREVIYVLLYDKHNFDKEYFIQQVLSAYNSLIPDDALVWEIPLDTLKLTS